MALKKQRTGVRSVKPAGGDPKIDSFDGKAEANSPQEYAARLLLELQSNLRDIFNEFHDPTIDPAVELRGRYAAALSHVENFLGQTGAAQKVSRKFGGLAIILLDLARGVIHPILRTPHPVSTRPEDREDIWVLRALAAVGVDCLSRAMAQSKAATEAARKYPKLSRLLRPGTQLDSCLLNWRSSLKKRTAKNKAAIHAFHDGLAVLAGRQIQQPEHFALIGHHMLASAEQSALSIVLASK